jgi:hypothetical protein
MLQSSIMVLQISCNDVCDAMTRVNDDARRGVTLRAMTRVKVLRVKCSAIHIAAGKY